MNADQPPPACRVAMARAIPPPISTTSCSISVQTIGLQSTGDRVNARGQGNERHAPAHGDPEESVQRECTHVKHRGDFDEDIDQQNEEREEAARRSAVTTLEKLRHRIKTVPKIERQENPEEGIEPDQNCAPFTGHRDESPTVSDAHHADEVVTADIGGHDAAADHPPRQFFAAEKVFATGGVARARRPRGQRSDRSQVGEEDEQIEGA